ncbi:hypothetical protein AAP_06430 [Ascosphaera apis ARSEF 7405]|uniref:Ubiquitin-like protease family profile domain-containing protein n=1 Tax=Ascosphaera apis ARSEF 7405 TaxID=392613 RepID=A0A167UT43_9EURO|nr:hypothetical protein AAP_06430 [Ascosphaera apis ARSEF 7405]
MSANLSGSNVNMSGETPAQVDHPMGGVDAFVPGPDERPEAQLRVKGGIARVRATLNGVPCEDATASVTSGLLANFPGWSDGRPVREVDWARELTREKTTHDHALILLQADALPVAAPCRQCQSSGLFHHCAVHPDYAKQRMGACMSCFVKHNPAQCSLLEGTPAYKPRVKGPVMSQGRATGHPAPRAALRPLLLPARTAWGASKASPTRGDGRSPVSAAPSSGAPGAEGRRLAMGLLDIPSVGEVRGLVLEEMGCGDDLRRFLAPFLERYGLQLSGAEPVAASPVAPVLSRSSILHAGTAPVRGRGFAALLEATREVRASAGTSPVPSAAGAVVAPGETPDVQEDGAGGLSPAPVAEADEAAGLGVAPIAEMDEDADVDTSLEYIKTVATPKPPTAAPSVPLAREDREGSVILSEVRRKAVPPFVPPVTPTPAARSIQRVKSEAVLGGRERDGAGSQALALRPASPAPGAKRETRPEPGSSSESAHPPSAKRSKSMADLQAAARSKPRVFGPPHHWLPLVAAFAFDKGFVGPPTVSRAAGFDDEQCIALYGCLSRRDAWVTDSVIAAYGTLVRAIFPGSFMVDPLLTSCLRTGGFGWGAELQGLQAQVDGVKTATLVLFPVFWEEERHWTLIAYDFIQHQKAILDSLNMDLNCSPLCERAEQWMAEVRGTRLPAWSLTHGGPRQMNGVDCGVFVLLAMRILSGGWGWAGDFPYTGAQVPGLRFHLLCELITGRLATLELERDVVARETLREFLSQSPAITRLLANRPLVSLVTVENHVRDSTRVHTATLEKFRERVQRRTRPSARSRG